MTFQRLVAMKLRHRRRRRGQGITEYIIIVGLIAIVCIAAVTQLGETLDASYTAADDRMDQEVLTVIEGAGGGGQGG